MGYYRKERRGKEMEERRDRDMRKRKEKRTGEDRNGGELGKKENRIKK